MKLTRRQFSLGVLFGALALIVGRIFRVARAHDECAAKDDVEARHWTSGDRLAG